MQRITLVMLITFFAFFLNFGLLDQQQKLAASPTDIALMDNLPNETIDNPSTGISPNEPISNPPLYEPAPDPSGLSLYQLGCYINDAGNFSIGYPEAIWEKNEGADRVVFLAPLENSNDTFREGLIVSFQNLSSTPNLRLEDYANSTLSSLLKDYANSTLSSLTQSLPVFQLIESAPTTVSAADIGSQLLTAYKLVYSWQQDQNQLKTMQIFTVKGDKIYTFVYTADFNKYDIYLPNIQQMIDSMDFCSRAISIS